MPPCRPGVEAPAVSPVLPQHLKVLQHLPHAHAVAVLAHDGVFQRSESSVPSRPPAAAHGARRHTTADTLCRCSGAPLQSAPGNSPTSAARYSAPTPGRWPLSSPAAARHRRKSVPSSSLVLFRAHRRSAGQCPRPAAPAINTPRVFPYSCTASCRSRPGSTCR